MNENKSSIYSKLWSIQTKIEEIIKGEENKIQNYFFFNEFQVLNSLKPLFEKYKIAIFFSDEENNESITYNEKYYLVKYIKKMEVVDVESLEKGESIEEGKNRLTYRFLAFGLNSDPAKAKGAADTYAIKYVLTKFFLIPVKNNDDPDYQIGQEKTKIDQDEVDQFFRKHKWNINSKEK